jgi:hypothetical protein
MLLTIVWAQRSESLEMEASLQVCSYVYFLGALAKCKGNIASTIDSQYRAAELEDAVARMTSHLLKLNPN